MYARVPWNKNYIYEVYIIKWLLHVRAYISVIVAFMRRITVIPQSERSSVVAKDNGGKLADIIRYTTTHLVKQDDVGMTNVNGADTDITHGDLLL